MHEILFPFIFALLRVLFLVEICALLFVILAVWGYCFLKIVSFGKLPTTEFSNILLSVKQYLKEHSIIYIFSKDKTGKPNVDDKDTGTDKKSAEEGIEKLIDNTAALGLSILGCVSIIGLILLYEFLPKLLHIFI
ncbi:TPA: hypothetical protein ACGIK9_003275 [Acinetobacter baumannii]|uniref:hypothetical protein n=1 Tax=Acinetobacter baumannii TaxID=470 RepID=UPI00338E6206